MPSTLRQFLEIKSPKSRVAVDFAHFAKAEHLMQ